MSEFTSAASWVRKGMGTVHLLGIAGFGMAGLAYLLHKRGFRVSGCDVQENRLTDRLRAEGVAVHHGHDVNHLPEDTDWMIRSTAVRVDHPEVRWARDRDIPVFLRGETLPALFHDRFSIAVSGTHGKTTTTALIAHILAQAGQSPSYFVGGELDPDGTVAGEGRDRTLVVEADESDGTLVLYHPHISVVTNIDYDHMEHFPDEDAFFACFKVFAAQTGRRLIYMADDARALDICASHPRALSCGCNSGAVVRADNVVLDGAGSRFDLLYRGMRAGSVGLPLPGMHNVRNALLAYAVAREMECPHDAIVRALARFRPVRRRFEPVASRRDIRIYSDYAHHPAEIRALVQSTILLKPGRLLALFQPHRYTRTRMLADRFPDAFEGVDRLWLVPVYAASEPELIGGTSRDLLGHFEKNGAPRTLYMESLEKAWQNIRSELKAGDVLLIIGAGDVVRVADWARRDI